MEEQKQVSVTVKMDTDHMFNFLMHHTYFSFLGVAGLIISFVSLGAAIYAAVARIQGVNILVLILAASLFTVVQPVMLYVKAKKQVERNASFKKELNYIFSQAGITISQGETENTVPWSEVVSLVSTSKCILVYLSKIRALVLPKKDIQDHQAFEEILRTNCQAPGKIKF